MVSELEFGNYLKELRLNNKMTIHQLAESSGISTSQISRIENGMRGIPKPETIHKLSKALNISYDEMLANAGYMSKELAIEMMARDKMDIPSDWTEAIQRYKVALTGLTASRWNQLSAEENVLSYKKEGLTRIQDLEDFIKESDDPIQILKAVNEKKDIEQVLDNLDTLIKNGKKNSQTKLEPYISENMARLPILGSIRAGEPIDRIEYNEGYTLIDPDLLRGRDGFALRVKGDSMSGDRILEGDIVIVLKQEEVQPSDIAVVAINGDEATLKRVKLHGDIVMLSPSNPAYEPQLLPAKDVSIIGKVVEVKFWPK